MFEFEFLDRHVLINNIARLCVGLCVLPHLFGSNFFSSAPIRTDEWIYLFQEALFLGFVPLSLVAPVHRRGMLATVSGSPQFELPESDTLVIFRASEKMSHVLT